MGAGASDAPRVPVLLVTDIGSDIDDTLALLAIAGLSAKIDLVGIVTTGGNCLDRAVLVRGWLRRLGRADADLPVAPGAPHEGKDCVLPEGFDTLAEGEESFNLHAAGVSNLVLGLAQKHASKLVVVCIGPVTPLAAVIRDDTDGVLRCNLKAFYMQASATIEGGDAVDGAAASVRLVASSEAFNFREDMEGAQLVLDALQETVPFYFLGKHAAYTVGITTADFRSWDRPSLPQMSELVRAQMNRFRQTGPELFYKIYQIPEDKRTEENWFFHLKDDVISRPYDPLLVLLLVHPELFEPQSAGHHQLVGNTPETPGVPDPEVVRGVLKGLVLAAVDHASQLAH